jgi:hypothetical protein
MICFEISLNGRKICTAGVGDQRVEMTALVCAVAGSADGSETSEPTITLDVKGATDDLHMTWLDGFDDMRLGDTVTLRVVDCAEPDPPRTQKDTKTLSCLFCHRVQGERRKAVAGPPVFICNKCVDTCVEILKADR